MTNKSEIRRSSPAELIDEICDRFEQGWRSGTPPAIEGLVQSRPEPIRAQLFRELLAVDRDYVAKAGLQAEPEELIERFSELGSWVRSTVLELFPETASWCKSDTSSKSGGAPLPTDSPRMIGKYSVLGVLGKGGMGTVYLAEQPGLRRTVAIKVMKPALAEQPLARSRFLREAEAAAKVRHDNVVIIHDVVDDPSGTPFIVMEHLRGESLEARLRREPIPSPQLTLKIGLEIAAGLDAAHKVGLVHRDVKPANVWLESEPEATKDSPQVKRIKVLDFGLARAIDNSDGVTSPGMVVGTASFMSPEQAEGQNLDARSDLFSLGCILYRMLSGRPAFEGPSLIAILKAVATHHPTPPDEINPSAHRALSELTLKLLEKNPDNRPRSAAEVVAAIGEMDDANSRRLGSQSHPKGHRLSWLGSRRGLAMLAGCLMLFALAIVAGRTLHERLFPAPRMVVTDRANLSIRVKRAGYDAKPLSEVVPLRSGDSLQIRFKVPSAVHASLFYVNGKGQLDLLKSYPPEKSTYEATWPGPGEARELTPPLGTEFFFVCGRVDRAVALEEVREAWNASAPWPALEPKDQLLRFRSEEITREGTVGRDLSQSSVPFPDGDAVKGRLDQFRGKLLGFDVLDGLAFRHE